VDAPVFKIGERSRAASAGGFDSHPLPLIIHRNVARRGRHGTVLPLPFAAWW